MRILLLILLISCSRRSPNNNNVSQVSSCIIGGHETSTAHCGHDQDTFSSVGALTYKGKIYCSGTLISKNLFLTAAHCFKPRMNIKDLGVVFGEGKEGGRVDSFIPLEDYKIYPKYLKGILGQNDIAVAIIKNQKRKIQKISTSYQEYLLLKNKKLTPYVVGFGQRSNQNPSKFGRKFVAQLSINKVNSYEFRLSSKGKDSCQGDSGGPVLSPLNGEWKLVGITARGPKKCASSFGTYTYAANALCWLNSVGANIPIETHLCPTPITSNSFQEICKENPHIIKILKKKYSQKNCSILETILQDQSSIDLQDSWIHDVSPLKFFPRLRKLNLSRNRIQDISPLLKLNAEIILNYNPNLKVKYLKKCTQCRISPKTLPNIASTANFPLFKWILKNHPKWHQGMWSQIISQEGFSVLTWASVRGHGPFLKKVLNSNFAFGPGNINLEDLFGHTPLAHAILERNPHLVRYLCTLAPDKGQELSSMTSSPYILDILKLYCPN